jgi:myo-inositol-1(or 4)-monophosphatase
MINLNEVLSEVKSWVLEVGKLQKDNFRRVDLAIDTKSTVTDLVTEIDKKSEEFIIEKIKALYPDHAILAEETGKQDKDSDYLWVIDPLDGTNNYAQGIPIFVISIALQYKGDSVLGVIYAPYLNELFYAVKDQGAYFNNKKLKISDKTDLNQCILATGFPYDKNISEFNNTKYVSNILPELRGLRRMGAAAFDLAYVAASLLDGYWEMNLNLWDVAAGMLLVEEAGGKIIHFRNDRKISIIAANNIISDKIQNIIITCDK